MLYIGSTKIGKMFLGDVEIAKAYLGNELVFQKTAQEPSYIDDGLAIWLDGKDKGSNPDAWIEKVGGYIFTNSGATFNEDYVYFDGSSFLSATGVPAIASASGTIELVYEASALGTTQLVYMPSGTTAAMGVGFSTNNRVIFGCVKTNRSVYTTTTTKASISLNADRGLSNGVAMTKYSSNTYWSGANTTTTYVGKRSAGAFFRGKIYCIRIYNRKLSQAEMLANLAVDNTRFNLGLTL